MSTSIFGTRVDWPVGISPTTFHKIVSPLGELDTVRAAQNLKSIYIQACFSTTAIEDVAKAGPYAVKWMQTYIFKNDSTTTRIIRTAEKNGYKAIVLSVDSPLFGVFRIPKINLTGLELPNIGIITGDPRNFLENGVDNNLSINRVREIIKLTKLPVIANGVMTVKGARIARSMGFKGIIV